MDHAVHQWKLLRVAFVLRNSVFASSWSGLVRSRFLYPGRKKKKMLRTKTLNYHSHWRRSICSKLWQAAYCCELFNHGEEQLSLELALAFKPSPTWMKLDDLGHVGCCLACNSRQECQGLGFVNLLPTTSSQMLPLLDHDFRHSALWRSPVSASQKGLPYFAGRHFCSWNQRVIVCCELSDPSFPWVRVLVGGLTERQSGSLTPVTVVCAPVLTCRRPSVRAL